MIKKATWIFVLLAALLVISVSAAFAASATQPAQASVTPRQELTASGKFQASKLTGLSRGTFKVTQVKSSGKGDCPFRDSTAAY